MLTPCHDWLERLSIYLDGESDAPERAAVEQHLHDCAACRAWTELARCDAQDVCAALSHDASEHFAANVMAQIGGVAIAEPLVIGEGAGADRYEEIRVKPRKSFWARFAEVVTVFGVLVVFAMIIAPTFSKSREKARQTRCMSNQKQIALAFSMYAQDNNGALPSAESWTKEIDVPEMNFDCPLSAAKGNDYAYNRALSDRKIADFETTASITPLTFDAKDGQPAYRHNNGLIVSYLDSHVEYLSKRQNPLAPPVQPTGKQGSSATFAAPTKNYGLAEKLQMAYTASMAMQSEDVQGAMESTEVLFRTYDGFVMQSTYTGAADGALAHATINGRVPTERVGEALLELGKLGTVTARTINGEDLTANHLKNEEALQDLAGSQGNLSHIGSRAGSVDGALRVEDRRTEAANSANDVRADEYDIKRRVTLAEISVEISAEPMAQSTHSVNPYVASASGATRALGAFCRWLLTVIIPLVIWLPVWGSVLGVVLYGRRKYGWFRRAVKES